MSEIIIDVRTQDEWNQGHANCTTSIPLQELPFNLEKLKQYDRIKLVCQSGNRVNMAIGLLRQAGLTMPMENLGSWLNVSCN